MYGYAFQEWVKGKGEKVHVIRGEGDMEGEKTGRFVHGRKCDTEERWIRGSIKRRRRRRRTGIGGDV